MTLQDFESEYGKFIVALYDEKHDSKLPLCIWSEKYIVATEKHSLEILIKSYLRNPEI